MTPLFAPSAARSVHLQGLESTVDSKSFSVEAGASSGTRRKSFRTSSPSPPPGLRPDVDVGHPFFPLRSSHPWAALFMGHDLRGQTMEKKRILLVDDSATTLLTMRMILDEAVYEVLTARDGEEAVEKAAIYRPALILLDVLMPRMDGFEACRRLRSRQDTKSIPIIMVTMRSEREHVEAAYRNGCNDYITKPIDSLEFQTKVKSYLGDPA